MKLIKKVEGRQKYRNHNPNLIKLSNKYNCEVVYMPYGIDGSGYYIKEVK